jgi:hypothetical protein
MRPSLVALAALRQLDNSSSKAAQAFALSDEDHSGRTEQLAAAASPQPAAPATCQYIDEAMEAFVDLCLPNRLAPLQASGGVSAAWWFAITAETVGTLVAVVVLLFVRCVRSARV